MERCNRRFFSAYRPSETVASGNCRPGLRLHQYILTVRSSFADQFWVNSAGFSGASGDFRRENGRWRTEYRQATKHKCLISGRFPSVTRVTGHASAADEGLLSADAPEPL